MQLFNKKKKFNLSLPFAVRGEKAAQNYLRGLGYSILETNFCNTKGKRLGEIDIIAKDGNEFVFVEVKTRKIAYEIENSPLPEENITRAKLYKLNKVASYYLSLNKLKDSSYRFDAVTIMANPSHHSAKLRHFKNIFIDI